MPTKPKTLDPMPWFLAGLILVQSVCAGIFLADVTRDLATLGQRWLADSNTILELVASLSLVIGIGLEGWFLAEILRRHARAMRSLGVASGALHELMEEFFRTWGLTPSEADVAAFTIKGMSIAEVASVRGTREGTIKTHLNAIYRKAGVAGRGQLVSLLVEDLMGKPLIAVPDNRPLPPRAIADPPSDPPSDRASDPQSDRASGRENLAGQPAENRHLRHGPAKVARGRG